VTDPLPRSPVVSATDAVCRGPEHASRRLVLLHGWGADADDLLDLGAALVDRATSVVALRAPQRHPGGSGRQWYDLQRTGWPDLPLARRHLRARLEVLAGSVPFERTALLGFSQGAAMALDVATGGGAGEGRDGLPLAGLISCSGYPHQPWHPQPRTRFLLTHGRADPVVTFAAMAALEASLRSAGAEVRTLDFAGGHGIEPGLMPAMRAFLAAGWPPLEAGG
jgi:phospholipase/carboxylesterase